MLSLYDPTDQIDSKGNLKTNTKEMRTLGTMMALGGEIGQKMLDRAYEITWTELVDKPETIKSRAEWDRVVLAALRHTQRIRKGYGTNFKVLETKTSADGKLELIYDKDRKPKMQNLCEGVVKRPNN